MSPNPNVKVFVGAPALFSAAVSGYADASTITMIMHQTQSQYSSFDGVTLWDTLGMGTDEVWMGEDFYLCTYPLVSLYLHQ